MWGVRVAMMNGFPGSTLHPREGEGARSTHFERKPDFNSATCPSPADPPVLSQVHGASLLWGQVNPVCGATGSTSSCRRDSGPSCFSPTLVSGLLSSFEIPSVTEVRFCDFSSQTSRVLPERQTDGPLSTGDGPLAEHVCDIPTQITRD